MEEFHASLWNLQSRLTLELVFSLLHLLVILSLSCCSSWESLSQVFPVQFGLLFISLPLITADPDQTDLVTFFSFGWNVSLHLECFLCSLAPLCSSVYAALLFLQFFLCLSSFWSVISDAQKGCSFLFYVEVFLLCQYQTPRVGTKHQNLKYNRVYIVSMFRGLWTQNAWVLYTKIWINIMSVGLIPAHPNLPLVKRCNTVPP